MRRCIFSEVQDKDADDEEYEAAVVKWIYGYNAYERLGSVLNDTVYPLHRQLFETGEFPTEAGIDALRAWAFVITRGHDKSCNPDSLLVAHPELHLILEAIRNKLEAIRTNPTRGIEELPPPPSRRH